MKLAVISGDGLPVSGLLTVFRNVVAVGTGLGVLDLPIAADLGYSWRPDKPTFYPDGRDAAGYPDWLSVRTETPAAAPDLADRWVALREAVAEADSLDSAARAALEAGIEELARPYEDYFDRWLAEESVDWVCAINMTLSDAVPVTLALHRAAAKRWGSGRPGGVLFWDHDLFGSYAVKEHGVRVYPTQPNELTPVPGAYAHHRWAVVSDDLAKEAERYETPLTAAVVPNVLPEIPSGELDERHRQVLDRYSIGDRPVVVVPVRVFRVKGVEMSVALLRAVRDECTRRGLAVPFMLVFGSMSEDPEYAVEVRAAVDREGVADIVGFLDGVPISSYRTGGGDWLLDEIDLLRISAATGGGVFFTPNCPDVESIGLGPALAAMAGVPCAVTSYTALHTTYGAGYRYAMVRWPDGLDVAARDFVDLMAGRRDGDPTVLEALATNRELVLEHFPDGPWRDLLQQMSGALTGATPRETERTRMATAISASAMGTRIGEVTLSDADRSLLAGVLDDAAERFGRVDDPRLLREVAGWAHLLPAAVREALQAMRYAEATAALVVRGGPVTDPGPTPGGWRERDPRRTLRSDLWLLLVSAQLGDPLCWSTLQNGSLVADVLPVAGQEEAQTGHGSRAELEFHVEDAFHDDRCDGLALLCLRNEDRVPTTIASVDCLDLSTLDVRTLSEPRFLIEPDPEHLRGLPEGHRIEPRRRAVLAGPAAAPYLRVDPAFTQPVPGDDAAGKAFADLCDQLRAGLIDAETDAGDLLVIDNHRAVHGRRPFRARYDGRDRWLHKMTVNRDIRRSRARRCGVDSRVLIPFV